MSAALLASVACGSAAAALLVTANGGALPRRSGRSRARSPRPLAVAAVVAVVVSGVSAGLHGRHLGLAAVLVVAVLGVLRGVQRGRREQLAQQRRLQVVDYCEALVGELRAGRPVTSAVERSAEVWPEADVVAGAARLGASVPAAMRRLADLPGAAAVRRLAGAWEISASTGAGLVLAVEQVLATVRAEEATNRLVRAELASARATARLVTTLPLVVLMAAQGIGARPAQFLLDTSAGVACLGAGVALSLAGLTWIDRIAARSVEGGG